jgi:transcriptional regulator with XRE-family HTH domain
MEQSKKSKSARKRGKVEAPFAENLRRIMDERAVSLKSVATMAGVGSPVVSSWLQGSMPHDPLAVQRLARALSVDFEFLLTGESSRTDPSSISLHELFREEQTAFSGIFRIQATRLVRRGDDDV